MIYNYVVNGIQISADYLNDYPEFENHVMVYDPIYGKGYIIGNYLNYHIENQSYSMTKVNNTIASDIKLRDNIERIFPNIADYIIDSGIFVFQVKVNV